LDLRAKTKASSASASDAAETDAAARTQEHENQVDALIMLIKAEGKL